MKQIEEELLDELIDIAEKRLNYYIQLCGISKCTDAIIADTEQTIRDAKKCLYNET